MSVSIMDRGGSVHWRWALVRAGVSQRKGPRPGRDTRWSAPIAGGLCCFAGRRKRGKPQAGRESAEPVGLEFDGRSSHFHKMHRRLQRRGTYFIERPKRTQNRLQARQWLDHGIYEVEGRGTLKLLKAFSLPEGGWACKPSQAQEFQSGAVETFMSPNVRRDRTPLGNVTLRFLRRGLSRNGYLSGW